MQLKSAMSPPAAVQEKSYIMVISAPMAPSHTHNMAGDASRRASTGEQSCWSEVNSRMLEIPYLKTRGSRRHSNKFTVILLRSR